MIDLILLLIIIVSILLMIYTIMYNNFQNYILRINKVENNINNNLKKKYDLLKNFSGIMTKKIKSNEEINKELMNLKDIKMLNVNFDQKLTDIYNKLFETKEINKELNKNKSLNKILEQLDDIEKQLIAYKSYYNDNVLKHNKLVRMFPTNIISKISKIEEKSFYGDININDENNTYFKI